MHVLYLFLVLFNAKFLDGDALHENIGKAYPNVNQDFSTLFSCA